MRKVECAEVSSFTQISENYPDDYLIVEIINIDYSIGEEIGKVIYICDDFEEAVDISAGIETIRSTILLGVNCMNYLGGIA